MGRFWVFFHSHTAAEFQLWFLFPPLHVGHPLGFAPESDLEDLGQGGAAAWAAWVLAAPGTQGSWQRG